MRCPGYGAGFTNPRENGATNAAAPVNRNPTTRITMPKYVIERDIPGAGKLTPEQLTAISQKSCGVLNKLGPGIQWVESFVTDDKVYCVYIAPNEALVREHAKQGGFPANRVSQVRTVINPTTAEG
ncbi:MAG TPA: DUF4242 domain-containing protein [Opitutaceae bacterium]|nr:DUF4242 domain-containing protein [Opitutaceae bacterium]